MWTLGFHDVSESRRRFCSRFCPCRWHLPRQSTADPRSPSVPGQRRVAVAFCFSGFSWSNLSEVLLTCLGTSALQAAAVMAQTLTSPVSYRVSQVSEQGVGLEDVHLRGLSVCPHVPSGLQHLYCSTLSPSGTQTIRY